MGNVISFEKGKRKRGNESNSSKKKSKMAAEKTTCDSSRLDADYSDMESEDQILECWKRMEKEEEEKFRNKYSGILAAVPITAGAKMQYFAAVMLQLLPDVFQDTWDMRFDAFSDFCRFYMSYFDLAYSDYLKENKELEKPYYYTFKYMSEKELEKELEDCLKKIMALYPEKSAADKTAMLHEAARLFELQDLLSDLFCIQVTND